MIHDIFHLIEDEYSYNRFKKIVNDKNFCFYKGKKCECNWWNECFCHNQMNMYSFCLIKRDINFNSNCCKENILWVDARTDQFGPREKRHYLLNLIYTSNYFILNYFYFLSEDEYL